ncbi:MAG: mannose-1-phosphate guanylyltransferase [bacterium]
MSESKATASARAPYAVVLAGGRGTRFWPLSRRDRPKQLLAFLSGEPLLRDTLDRLEGLVPAEQRCLVVPEDLVAACAKVAGEVPLANVFVEPVGRNTAPCLALAALHLRRRDPAAVMLALPADHHVGDPEGFRAALRTATAVAREGALVTLGIKPTRPDTGFGYIRVGGKLGEREGNAYHRVDRFVEKPDRARAESYVARGDHLWNAGIFAWRVDSFLSEVARQMPELGRAIERIDAVLGTAREREEIAKVWAALPSVSVDVGVLENALEVRVVPSDFGWSDVGSWSALREVLPASEGGVQRAARHLSIDSENCIVVAPNRLVATVGLKDTLVVVVDDAVLVCPLSRDQELRDVVRRIEEEGLTDYL